MEYWFQYPFYLILYHLHKLPIFVPPSRIAILVHDIFEAMLDVVSLEIHSLGMDDGGMLEIGLKTIFKFGRNGVKFVFDRFEDFSAFGRIDKDKAYTFIIFVDIGGRLLPSPKVCDGNIARTSGIAEVTFAATVAEHNMLIKYVCEVHFIPPPRM